MKKNIFISSVVMTGLLAVGSLGVIPVRAQSQNQSQIVQRLASRFNLNVDEVQEVFEEERAAHHALMLESFEEKLNEAVAGGKITADQKQMILDKHEEMYAKMDEIRSLNLSPEEMRAKMDQYRSELRAWAESENIDVPLFPFGKGEKRGHKGQMMGFLN